MQPSVKRVAPSAAALVIGLVIWVLTLACGPTAAPQPTPTTNADAFAVVRATSQAAYQAGQAAIAKGDYLQACVDLDTAKTNDPDNRADIQQALDQALARCLTPVAQPTSAPAAAPDRTLVVATIAAGVGTALAPTPAVAPANQTPPAAVQSPSAAASPRPSATTISAVAAQPTTGAGAALVTWNDPQGRFTIGAPPDWTRADQPQSLIGTSLVEFHDPSNRAEVDVAVDSTAHAVSPELYAASLELAMQRQVPGYAGEQVVPGTTAGAPSIRRVFTFTQKDASGENHQARGFQLVIVKGSTPYVISGTTPAEQFDQFNTTFNQIVDSFRFS